MNDEIINESPINGLPQIPIKPLPMKMPVAKWSSEKRKKQGAPYAGVYILRRLDKELYKVGCSTNLRSRIREIQLSIKAFTTLECEILFRRPRLLEAAIHRHFTEKCVEGEWYQLNAADLEFLKSIDPDEFILKVYAPPVKGKAPTTAGHARAVRNMKMQEMRKRGMTLREIGEQFDISYERVRQILSRIDRISLNPGATPQERTE